ncbi:MAG: aconitase family protein, partial [Chloroflexota bacterium]|nr:aconitase family protein [Chloroflexota bacterium]
MAMTISEKILAAHAGKRSVSPGDLVNVKVDLVMANDITAPISIREFQKLGVSKVFDTQRVVLVLSHFVPNKDIASATQAKITRDFARQTGVTFFDEGHGGIEHILLPQEGIVVPGDVYIGADSHTTTPGALCAFTCGMGSTDIAIAMATGEIWMKAPSTLRFIYHGKPGPWTRSKDLILFTLGQIGTERATYRTMQFEGEAISGLSMDA